MSFIEYFICPLADAIDNTVGLIEEVYEKRDQEIESNLAGCLDFLKDELHCLIEYPYVDRIYRDSYYSYFSSKHNEYYRDCIRISLFDIKLKDSDFRSRKSIPRLEAAFRGYVIIRPTFPHIIGRTLIDPRAFKKGNFRICQYSAAVSVNGIKLQVSGFPFSSQDGESISCAETTIWGIMEYFGNKYADYQPAAPSKIIQVLNQHSKKRLIPSAGLTVDQISLALKEFGFGTQIYAAEDAYGLELMNIISVYIESGIPIIAALENESTGHAVLLIGHEKDHLRHFSDASRREIEYHYLGKVKKYIDYSDLPKRFIVNDDNLTPYRSISLSDPVEHYEPTSGFMGCTIAEIVVPLYKKVYLDVLDAKGLILQILVDIDFGYELASDFVFRFFLASSRSFKYHVACLPGLPVKLKDYIVACKMPKFIWCGEFSTKGSFLNGKVAALILVDATEANNGSMDSLIFAGYPDRCVVQLQKEFIPLPSKFRGYTKFVSNLQ
ncbi:MAG TPA: papain-like cysteine protease family protein [Puia sp.]|nr:papain-like cysteine protease family protein [Puia sp.]